VFVARALENERRVTAVRLAALALMGLSQDVIAGLSGEAAEEDPVQGIAIAVYAVFAIAAFIGVRRVTESATVVRVMPFVAATFDVGFMLAMDITEAGYGAIHLEGTATMLALVISYSLLRYGIESLVYSTALAITAFTVAMWLADQFSWGRWSFVVFGFIASAILLGFTRVAVRRAFLDLQRRELLSRLVAPKVVDEILAGRESSLRPTRREVTVLFADIRDFTTFSEAREPEEVLRFLDDYFGRMTQVVHGREGSVNKFLGDGLMALWGAPEPLADHAVHAVRAALDMQKVMREINERRVADGEPPLRIGIGVHTGFVAAGMLGGSGQSEYSVIGDAVNLASRIEGLTREYAAEILVSDATWQILGGQFAGERIGEVTVKGRRAGVVIHSLHPLGAPDPLDTPAVSPPQ
jgi:adenylate cyclase